MDKFTLTNENIKTAVDTVRDFLQKYKVNSKDALRILLSMEEAFIDYRDAFGTDTTGGVKCAHRFGRLCIEITVKGDSMNPFESDNEDEFSRLMLSGIGLAPVWRYKNNTNIIVFTPKKKKTSQMIYLLSAVLLAFLCGGLSSLLPQETQSFISAQVLTPVFDTFIGLINAVAGVMIFLSVVWGICNVGDMDTLSTIGKKMIGRMFLIMAAVPTAYLILILPLFDFSSGKGESVVDITGVFDLILGIIPSNLISPFVEGNFLQIIFIAAMVGIALLILGGKTILVSSFVEQANMVIHMIMETICSLISLMMFISLYNLILTGSFSVLLEVYKAPLLILIGCFFTICLYTAYICIRKKVSLVVFVKKLLPSYLIGLTTASSSAAMSTVMETCEKRLGIDRKIVNFGVPLGQIIFGVASVAEFLVLAFSMAEIYSIVITPVWVIIAIITSLLLTVAAPPVPGGGVAICTILFSQLSIPMEGLAVAVAIDVIVDFIVTSTEIYCLQSELVILSDSLNMLNIKKLRSRKQSKSK